MTALSVPGRIGPAHPDYRRTPQEPPAPVLYPRSVPATSVVPGSVLDLGRGSLLQVSSADIVEGYVRIVGTGGNRVEVQVGKNVVVLQAN